eukprot:gnl/TRDRNA2_/TRDRNA2_182905_c0_seq1.p1 gnl/TRDRNA2_/TRDRNA2_182905_c0~~gnl/TRDRNA2_/TRDRNA2_182905_c0_seq1.p1  ORF type:complete len:453 (-),score=75.73 gnl/TRDRNA2_/TRDRNA2_182905_c0_seq1:44-1402(-)
MQGPLKSDDRTAVQSANLPSSPEKAGAADTSFMKTTLAGKGTAKAHSILGSTVNGRHVHIDVTRICCIICAALWAGNNKLGSWNVMFAQNWVLPLLWLVGGISYGLTSRALPMHIMRLSMYLFIGILVNWSAWVVNDWNWRKKLYDVPANMEFVYWLAVYSIILLPFKSHFEKLRVQTDIDSGAVEEDTTFTSWLDRNPAQIVRGILVLACGILCIMAFFHVVMSPLIKTIVPRSLREHEGALHHLWHRDENETEHYFVRLAWGLQASLGNIWIAAVFPCLFSDYSCLAWLLLLNTYLFRFDMSTGEFPFHNFNLMLVGLAVYYLGLKHRCFIGKYVVRYWMAVCFTCAFMWKPGRYGEISGLLFADTYEKSSFVVLEAICVISWLTAAEIMFDENIFAHDQLSWVNQWALLVFLLNQAVHWLLSEWAAWCFLLGLAPICYYLFKKKGEVEI